MNTEQLDASASLRTARRYDFAQRVWGRLTRGWVMWVMATLVLLVLVRLLLPYAMVWKMNRALAHPGAFHGHVQDISLSLWRGAYMVQGLRVSAPSLHGADPALEFAVDGIDIAIDWRQALHGRIRSVISVHRPHLLIRNLTSAASQVPLPGQQSANSASSHMERTPQADSFQSDAQSEAQSDKKPEEHWQDRVGLVIPFTVDTLHIDHGLMRYADEKRSIDLELSDVHGLISHIAGGRAQAATPATFTLAALTTAGGRLQAEGSIEPLTRIPTFDIKASIEGIHLVELNPSVKHLKGLTFTRGMFSAYTEMQAARGELRGYVKPLFIDLGVAAYGDDRDSAATKIFWSLAGVVANNILPNDDTNALAARIPIAGRFDQPHTDTWTIISSVLSNAFLSPIFPGFEELGRFYTKK